MSDATDLVRRLDEAAAFMRQGKAVIVPDLLALAAINLRALLAEAARLREALERWQHYGCPDCGGDCSSANPPVTCCIMQEARAALAKEAGDGQST